MYALTEFQVNTRTLLTLTACVALILAAGRSMFIWWQFEPIANQVNAANEVLAERGGDPRMGLDEDDVVDSLKMQLDNLQDSFVNETAKEQFEKNLRRHLEPIIRTKLLPRGSILELTKNGVATLQIPFDQFSGYKFMLRHPALKKKGLGQLFLDTEWIPDPGATYNWDGYNWIEDRSKIFE